MLKGKSVIELRNAETGKIEQVIEDENMVTNAAYNILNFFNAYNQRRKIGNMAQVLNPLLPNCFGGLMLFEKNITEDVNNIFPPSDNFMVGKAADSYTGADYTRGSLNTAESKEINGGKGYRYVWDFATNRANGAIRSVALTSYSGGIWGAQSQDYLDYNLSVMIANIGYIITSGGSESTADLIRPGANDVYESSYSLGITTTDTLTGVGCFDKDTFTTAISTTGAVAKSVIFVVYKLSNTYGLKGKKPETVKSLTVTSTKNFAEPSTWCTDGEKIYSISVTNSTTFDYIVLDGKTLAILEEKTITVQDAKFVTYTGRINTFHKGYIWIKSSVNTIIENTNVGNKFYRINSMDATDFSIVDLHAVKGKQGYYPEHIGDGLYFSCFDNSSSRRLYKGVRYIDNKGSYPCMYPEPSFRIIPSKFIKPPMILIGGPFREAGKQFGIKVFTPFLSTINNLTTPVVKNETQTMKVTYEITEV